MTIKSQADKLALYQFFGCPFCTIVQRAIARNNVEVELRDIHEEPEYLEQLVRARGRATVPVLRITKADGSEVWMPESRDIAHYLDQQFGSATR
ncbi:glutaredoxin family protein [Ferrimonas marina]|uniref:Glutaredoxin n=1 Tax=Ferrimonas marina TaxID=299255 RepID=A0A1M5MNA1_9GAMM|nr:glutaredoxin [Ferrimonas marina]SHG78253.1 Glutaredoxin [Ferrimonas marina]